MLQRSPPLIIIGERDPFMRRALEEVLSPIYRLEFVEDGAAIFDSVVARQPQAVILEILLPGRDGFQVCRRLKDDP